MVRWWVGWGMGGRLRGRSRGGALVGIWTGKQAILAMRVWLRGAPEVLAVGYEGGGE